MAALYQRARPVTFAELVGQEHVKDVLEAAVRGDRTSHAYLFSGPRGVGKTTTARLLAMAVNCEAEQGAARPCGECESCRMVRSVTHPDVIELDAASNNSVDDVRDLQSHMGLASMRGGKRVWILDEAHMLSKAAANALLKTLEEPPPGLIFILATTEPEKLPPTILSRCQHFRFRRLSDAEVVSKLARLCEEAGVEAEPEALALIARSADGGMRDAESLLDRLLVKGEALDRAAAESALGLPSQERLALMGTALLGADLNALLAEAGTLYRDGYAPRTVSEQLARAVRDELHRVLAGNATWVGSDRTALLTLLHALDDESERFVRQNDLYALEVALIKAVNALTPPVSPRIGAPAQQVEVQRPVAATEQRATTPPAKLEPEVEAPPQAAAQPTVPEFEPVKRRDTKPAADAPASKPAEKPTPQPGAQAAFSWHAIRSSAGPQLKAFLAPAQVEVNGVEVRVSYDEKHAFHRSQLLNRLDEFKAHIAAKAGPEFNVHVVGGSSPKERGRSPSPARTPRAPTPQASKSAQAEKTEPAAARATPPPTEELELAGFDEEHPAWMDEELTGAGESFEDAVRPEDGPPRVPRGKTGSLVQQATDMLGGAGGVLAEVQQLFPGRVTHVVAAETVARAAASGSLDDLETVHADADDPEAQQPEEDESQDGLPFGP